MYINFVMLQTITCIGVMHLNLKCSLIVFRTGSDRFKDSHFKDGAKDILACLL